MIYEEVLNILDKTLPNYMVVKTCASLQNEMNNFIQSIFPTYEVQLQNSKKGCEFFYTKDNTIMEQPKKRNNAWLNSKMSSGFEKALLTIAFKVSLAQLYGINVLILDEPDGAADKDNSLLFFENLLNASFDQIFLVSHKSDIREMILNNISNSICYVAEKGNFTIASD
jgi:chromosome segregation ATPase